MKNPKCITLLGTVLLCGCSHYYYVPNTQNVPLFREKNEYRIAAFYGAGDESDCAEVQAAYSITDKFGLAADFMAASGKDESNQNWAKGYYLDGAAGYYKPFGKAGVFEVYGGIGGSNQHHQYGEGYTAQNSGTSELSFMKLFVQPSFGLSYRAFDLALSTRISMIDFTNVKDNISWDTDEYYLLKSISDKNHYFIEPAITVRGGWKYVKLQVQVSYSFYMNKPKLDIGEYDHMCIGLFMSLSNKIPHVAQ